jgi:PadR family transcriptional regulator, regulatory protein PadR
MNIDGFGSQLRRGVIEFCVLALLAQREQYGFELVQNLSTADGLLISEGTIYPLLSRLRREGLVETDWRESTSGPPRKYYRLTPTGLETLTLYRRHWEHVRNAVDIIAGPAREEHGGTTQS